MSRRRGGRPPVLDMQVAAYNAMAKLLHTICPDIPLTTIDAFVRNAIAGGAG